MTAGRSQASQFTSAPTVGGYLSTVRPDGRVMRTVAQDRLSSVQNTFNSESTINYPESGPVVGDVVRRTTSPSERASTVHRDPRDSARVGEWGVLFGGRR